MTPPDSPRRSYRRRLGAFALALLALDLLILSQRQTWESYSPDGYTERVEHCAKQTRDLVFVGGSTIAEGVDPAIIQGISWKGQKFDTMYAVGLSGGTTTDVYFATRHACPKPPRMLVYGMTASDINDNRHEPHGPHSLMTLADVRDWCQTRPESSEWLLRHYVRSRAGDLWSAYRFRHGIRMWAVWQAEQLAPGCLSESLPEARRQREYAQALKTGHGYAPTEWFANRAYSEMKAGGWVQPPFEYLARYQTGSHLKYLHRLADWAKEHGTQLVLIDMPRTADLEARHPAEFAEYTKRIEEITRERQIPWIRAPREATGLGDQHFADLIHLNRPGAAHFSAWLRKELAKLGEVLPERDEGMALRTGVRP